MAEKMMDPELAAEIAAGVKQRAGTVGEKSVDISEPGKRHGSISLGRGGVITLGQSHDENYRARRREHVDKEGQLMYPGAPEPSQPYYSSGLASIRHHVGTDDTEGKHPRENITLDPDDSRHYALTQGEDGLWRAYDVSSEKLTDNYWTEYTEYFLDAARLIETDEEGIAIQGLFIAFDEAVKKQADRAVETYAGPLPQ